MAWVYISFLTLLSRPFFFTPVFCCAEPACTASSDLFFFYVVVSPQTLDWFGYLWACSELFGHCEKKKKNEHERGMVVLFFSCQWVSTLNGLLVAPLFFRNSVQCTLDKNRVSNRWVRTVMYITTSLWIKVHIWVHILFALFLSWTVWLPLAVRRPKSVRMKLWMFTLLFGIKQHTKFVVPAASLRQIIKM